MLACSTICHSRGGRPGKVYAMCLTTKFYHLPQRKAFDEKAKMREPIAKSLLRLSLKASLRRVLAAHEPGRHMWAEPGRAAMDVEAVSFAGLRSESGEPGALLSGSIMGAHLDRL